MGDLDLMLVSLENVSVMGCYDLIVIMLSFQDLLVCGLGFWDCVNSYMLLFFL